MCALMGPTRRFGVLAEGQLSATGTALPCDHAWGPPMGMNNTSPAEVKPPLTPQADFRLPPTRPCLPLGPSHPPTHASSSHAPT